MYRARGGTLVLRRVVELPARAQTKLSQLLRDGEAVLVEEERAMTLDVRPMAIVEPWFELAVDDGHVQAELHRQMAGVRIDLPALRNRREDIPELARHLLEGICVEANRRPMLLTHPVLSLLQWLPYRGNVGELRRLLETVVRLVRARTIRVEHVLANLRVEAGVTMPAAGRLREARARFEREHILGVLEQHGGRVDEAARALGIQRTNLYRKMRHLGISRRREG